MVVVKSRAIWAVLLTRCLKSGVDAGPGGVGEGCGGGSCEVESAEGGTVAVVPGSEPMG